MGLASYKVKRGEVWIADLNPGYGVEIHKKRPVTIISNNLINNHSPRLIVLPFTSQVYPTNPGKVLISKGEFNLTRESAILVSDIRSIDKKRLLKKLGVLTKDKLLEVEDALKLVLGIIELD